MHHEMHHRNEYIGAFSQYHVCRQNLLYSILCFVKKKVLIKFAYRTEMKNIELEIHFDPFLETSCGQVEKHLSFELTHLCSESNMCMNKNAS